MRGSWSSQRPATGPSVLRPSDRRGWVILYENPGRSQSREQTSVARRTKLWTWTTAEPALSRDVHAREKQLIGVSFVGAATGRCLLRGARHGLRDDLLFCAARVREQTGKN